MITVVTICYNAENDIEKTILSVINQKNCEIEYIIVDGASTDGTMTIVNRYREHISKIISEPDHGIYDAMNKGIKLATGDWISFMNAGDAYNNCEAVSTLLNMVESSTVIAYGDYNSVFRECKKIRKPYPLVQMNKRMCFGHPSTFVKSTYHKQHLFDTSYKICADYKMLYDAYYKDKVVFQYVPVVVADFEAENGISSTNFLLRIREDARIQEIDKTFIWRLMYCYRYVTYYTKQIIKKIVPKHFLDKRKKRLINNLH